jgi:hypothetical protein
VEKETATAKFQVGKFKSMKPMPRLTCYLTQAVADAYYVLVWSMLLLSQQNLHFYLQSDSQRRREYDSLYRTRANTERTTQPDASQSFFNTFASMFGGAAGAGTEHSTAEDYTRAQRPDADGVFGDVFEEVN